MIKNKELKDTLETLLEMAEQKLQYAIDKNKEWDIEHYRENVEYIKSELEIVNKK